MVVGRCWFLLFFVDRFGSGCGSLRLFFVSLWIVVGCFVLGIYAQLFQRWSCLYLTKYIKINIHGLVEAAHEMHPQLPGK